MFPLLQLLRKSVLTADVVKEDTVPVKMSKYKKEKMKKVCVECERESNVFALACLACLVGSGMVRCRFISIVAGCKGADSWGCMVQLTCHSNHSRTVQRPEGIAYEEFYRSTKTLQKGRQQRASQVFPGTNIYFD